MKLDKRSIEGIKSYMLTLDCEIEAKKSELGRLLTTKMDLKKALRKGEI